MRTPVDIAKHWAPCAFSANNTSALQHCFWQKAFPTAQWCSVRQVHSRDVKVQLHLAASISLECTCVWLTCTQQSACVSWSWCCACRWLWPAAHWQQCSWSGWSRPGACRACDLDLWDASSCQCTIHWAPECRFCYSAARIIIFSIYYINTSNFQFHSYAMTHPPCCVPLQTATM